MENKPTDARYAFMAIPMNKNFCKKRTKNVKKLHENQRVELSVNPQRCLFVCCIRVTQALSKTSVTFAFFIASEAHVTLNRGCVTAAKMNSSSSKYEPYRQLIPSRR